MKKNYIAPEIEVIRFSTEEVLAGVLVESGFNHGLDGVGGFDIFGADENVTVFED
jgi:hypothetical protein